MRKIIAILLIVFCMMFPLAACGNSAAAVYSATWGMKDVHEVSTYTVSIQRSNVESIYQDAPILFGEGKYVCTLTGGSDVGYTYTTDFSFVGYYEMADGRKVEVNDKITSGVVFKGAGNAFAPVSSTREYDGTTVEYDKENKSFSVQPLKYSQSVEYGEKSAVVKINKADGSQMAGLEKEREISYKTMPVDNEQLALVLRGLIKNDSGNYALSFNLLVPTMEKINSITVSIPKKSPVIIGEIINGKEEEFTCYKMTLSTGNIKGSSLLYYFAYGDNGDVASEVGGTINLDRSRLIKYLQNIPYSSDYFVYDLTGYVYGE